MAAFILFDVREIHDQDALSAYRGKVFETVEKFGGRYRVLGGLEAVLEGEWQPNIPVLIEFADLKTAKQWYNSPLYAPLKQQRLKASTCDAVLLEGYEH